jgi:hypothetical protein
MATLTTNKNYLQPTGFSISIERTNYPNLQFFAQSITHPGASVNVIELPVRRIQGIPLAGDKITFGELQVDFILDEDMEGYQEMQSWLERLVNEGDVTQEQALKDGKIATFADITVSILTSHNNVNKRIRYINALPTTIGSIEMNASQNQTFIQFTSSFRFDYFEII